MWRKNMFGLLVLLLLFVCSSPGTCAANDPVHQLTEAQLQQLEQKQKTLETNLTLLNGIINNSNQATTELLQLLDNLSKELIQCKQQIAELKKQLIESQTIIDRQAKSLNEADKSIESVNKLLAKYEREVNRRIEIGLGAVVAAGKIYPAATAQYNAGNTAYQVIGGQDLAGAFVKVRF